MDTKKLLLNLLVLAGAFLVGCGSSVVADPNTMFSRLDGSIPDVAPGADGGVAADASAPADAAAALEDGGQAPDAATEGDAGVVVSPETGDLVVNISGLSDRRGLFAWGLFDESRADAFPEGDPLRGDWISIPATSFPLEILSLPPGRYAVLVYHDRNADRSLNKGIFGQPTEDWGSTNNVTHPFSGPEFDESSIEIRAGYRTETDVELHD